VRENRLDQDLPLSLASSVVLPKRPANYALIEAFPAWHRSIRLGWVMVCFAIVCVVAIGFVYRFLPETEGLSVEGAVQVFEREAAGSGTTPRARFPRPLRPGQDAP
jgi:hypothetical protein